MALLEGSDGGVHVVRSGIRQSYARRDRLDGEGHDFVVVETARDTAAAVKKTFDPMQRPGDHEE